MVFVDLGEAGVPCLVGEPCGQGRGFCEASVGWGDYDTANTTALAGANATGFCQCAGGWSGKSDLLTFDGYACDNNETVEQVLYILALLATVYCSWIHWKALGAQLKSFKRRKEKLAKRGKAFKWYRCTSLVVVLLGIFGTQFGCFLLVIPKAMGLESRELGQDIVSSVGLALSGPMIFIVSSIHDIRFFRVIANGAAMPEAHIDRITKFMQITLAGLNMTYLSITWLSVFAGFFVDKVPPSESPMQLFLVLRAVTVIAFMATVVVIQSMVRKQTAAVLLRSSAPTSKKGSTSNSALGDLDEVTNTKFKSLIALTVVYVIFLTPRFWHLQAMPIVTFVILGQMTKSNQIHSYLPKKKSTATHPTDQDQSNRTIMSTAPTSTANSVPASAPGS